MSRELIEAGLGWHYTPPRMAALIAPARVTGSVSIRLFAVSPIGMADGVWRPTVDVAALNLTVAKRPFACGARSCANSLGFDD